MSTFAEVKSAVQKLPLGEQELLLRLLAKRLAAGPSCYDLVRELFEEPGRIGASGTRDLATNKIHLADFGRRPGRK